MEVSKPNFHSHIVGRREFIASLLCIPFADKIFGAPLWQPTKAQIDFINRQFDDALWSGGIPYYCSEGSTRSWLGIERL